MRYRAFAQLDWQPSALGFGAMRLPTSGFDLAAPQPNRQAGL